METIVVFLTLEVSANQQCRTLLALTAELE